MDLPDGVFIKIESRQLINELALIAYNEMKEFSKRLRRGFRCLKC